MTSPICTDPSPSQDKVLADAQRLSPGALVSLYELDLSKLPGLAAEPPFRWCNTGTVVFDGNTYKAMPIEITGFEASSTGALPRPKMSVSAFARGANGERVSLAAVVRDLRDLIGCRVRRYQIHAKYLDAVNFPAGNPLADPSAQYPVEEYYVNRKTAETPIQLDFELTSVLDLEGQKFPRRQVLANMCDHGTEYRGEFCKYSGTRYFDANDVEVFDASLDVCGRRMSSCICRHTSNVTVQVPVPEDLAGYAAEVLSERNKLGNPGMTPATGMSAWPDKWLHKPAWGFRVAKATAATSTRAPAFKFLDLTYKGHIQVEQTPLLEVDAEIAVADIPAGAFGMWLQIVSGALVTGAKLWLGYTCLDVTKAHSGQVLVTEIAADTLANLKFHQMPATPPAEFACTEFTENGYYETWQETTAFVRPSIFMTAPKTSVWDPEPDSDGRVEDSAPYDMTFKLRVGMPYLGSCTDFTAWTSTPLQDVVTQVVGILPFGGKPGAELVR